VVGPVEGYASFGGPALRDAAVSFGPRPWGRIDEASAMYLLDTRSRKVRELLSMMPNEIRSVAPSPDDRRIYFGLGSGEADVWLMSLP
jgi:hypothetical protein